MDPLIIAIIVAVFTLIVLFSGIPIAFGLSFVSIALLVAFEGFQMLDVFAETFYAGLNSFVLLSIPMFILMGMAVANSPAGKDLYTGLDRWLWRVPGGLVISNIGACSIFAALSGSSPATCAAIGTMGIPEMRKNGGLVINVSSHASYNAFPEWGAYCVSKSALAMFTKCLREEERSNSIRACTITLGSVNTPLWDSESINSDFDRTSMLSSKEVSETILYMAQKPESQLIEDLTLMPSSGAF